MASREFKMLLIQKLADLPVYYPSDDQLEHNVRCPYCGDSQKDPTHAHLWIHIDPDSNEAMPWLCFRCGVSGKVDADLLSDLDIPVDEHELKQLKSYNRRADKIMARKTIVKTEKFRVPECQPNYFTDAKIEYLNGRLGLRFGYEECQQNKVILSLDQFMRYNALTSIPGVEPWKLRNLESDYIGFLSTNNNLITFRNIHSDAKYRYSKIILNPYNTSNASFYSVPVQVPLFYEGPLTIHIAEGTFDILSIRYNMSLPTENAVFYASCGYRYLGIIKHLVRIGMCTDLVAHIYADRDKTDSDHIGLLRKNEISEFISHVYLHRNICKGEKDYGVTFDRIQDRMRQLW